MVDLGTEQRDETNWGVTRRIPGDSPRTSGYETDRFVARQKLVAQSSPES